MTRRGAMRMKNLFELLIVLTLIFAGCGKIDIICPKVDSMSALPKPPPVNITDERIFGRVYDNVSEEWINQLVIVDVDKDSNVSICVASGEKALTDGKQLTNIVSSLEKGLEWSKLSKENKIETKKPLGEFLNNDGYATVWGIKLDFVSENMGMDTYVLLTTIPGLGGGCCAKLNPEQTARFIAQLNRIPERWRNLITKLEDQEAKAGILK